MTRLEIIHELRRIFERDVPWIPLLHSEDYILYHSWLKNIKPQPITGAYQRYYEIDKDLRARLRKEWNKPIVWPAYVMLAVLILFLAPGIHTIRKERR